jgi:hypothetical protein
MALPLEPARITHGAGRIAQEDAMTRRHLSVPAALLLISAACSHQPDVKDVPIGAEVQVTRDDGALVEGTLAEKNDIAVKVDTGPIVRAVPISRIADVRLASMSVPEVPPKATFREVRVPTGTPISMRMLSNVGSDSSHAEDVVHAELTRPVVVEGMAVIPAGATVRGVVTQATPAGRVKGRASVGVQFNTLVSGTDRYTIDARVARMAAASTSTDAKAIGIPAAGGAIIGAIIGGKKGAAIGATAGAGGGTAVVLTTPGRPVAIARGAVVTSQLEQPIEVRVSLR